MTVKAHAPRPGVVAETTATADGDTTAESDRETDAAAEERHGAVGRLEGVIEAVLVGVVADDRVLRDACGVGLVRRQRIIERRELLPMERKPRVPSLSVKYPTTVESSIPIACVPPVALSMLSVVYLSFTRSYTKPCKTSFSSLAEPTIRPLDTPNAKVPWGERLGSWKRFSDYLTGSDGGAAGCSGGAGCQGRPYPLGNSRRSRAGGASILRQDWSQAERWQESARDTGPLGRSNRSILMLGEPSHVGRFAPERNLTAGRFAPPPVRVTGIAPPPIRADRASDALSAHP